MSITIDINRNPKDEGGGFLYTLYLDTMNEDEGVTELTLIGSGQESTLESVFANLQSLTERTI